MILARRSNVLAAFIVVLLILSLVSGCAPRPEPPATPGSPVVPDGPRYGGEYRVAMRVDPTIFTPVVKGWQATLHIAQHVYDMLVYVDGRGNLMPRLAQEWEVSADGLVYTFYLAENVEWHDGTPFDASQVKWCIENIFMAYPNPLHAYLLAMVDSVEAPEDNVLIITLVKSDPQFLYKALSRGDASILPRHLFENEDLTTTDRNLHPVGTGPFRFVEYAPSEYVRLEANENYWGGRPYLDKLTFYIITEPTTYYRLLVAGDLDGLSDNAPPPYPEWSDLMGNPDLSVESYPYWTIMRLMFNYNPDAVAIHPWITDVRVRQAFAHAIDKDSIIEFALYGVDERADSPLSPMFGWAYNDDLPIYEYSPEKAESLLDDAGYPRGAGGIRFTVQMPTYSNKDVAEMLVEMLGEVGIEVAYVAYESTGYLDAYYRGSGGLPGKYGITYFAGPTGPDPVLRLSQLYRSDMLPPAGLNHGWCGEPYVPHVDDILHAAEEARDFDEIARLLKEFQQVMIEGCYVIPLHISTAIETWNSGRFGGQPLWIGRAGYYTQLWWKEGRAQP